MALPKKGTHALLAHPCRVAFRWLAFQQGPSVLPLLLGVRASSVVVGSLALHLGSSSSCTSVWVCQEGCESLRVVWPSPMQGCGLRNR
ncbi:hypothetical protein Taro_015628 [Colocasia esculenta]|uniref:Uncharacterized protein n=1 Tax=Colocasia esculenta TaxID=4460 RepID=A0A843UQE8_COLES|nr:hypothetical protein [Colocasia esculenta]